MEINKPTENKLEDLGRVIVVNCPKMSNDEYSFLLNNSKDLILFLDEEMGLPKQRKEINELIRERDYKNKNSPVFLSINEENISALEYFIRDADTIIVGGTKQVITENIIKKSKNLKGVLVHATGWGILPNIKRDDVTIMNIPNYCTHSVAEVAISYALQRSTDPVHRLISHIISAYRHIDPNYMQVMMGVDLEFGGLIGDQVYMNYINPESNGKPLSKEMRREVQKVMHSAFTPNGIKKEVADSLSDHIDPLEIKSLGVVGKGHIGRSVLELAKAAGIKNLYSHTKNPNKYKAFDERVGVKEIGLVELLETCDVVSVHVAENEQTYGMFNYELMKHLKEDAVFINTSRTSTVMMPDLTTILIEKPKLHVCTDQIFRQKGEEKAFMKFCFDNTIWGRVYLLPHTGFNSESARAKKGRKMISALTRYMMGYRGNTINEITKNVLYRKIKTDSLEE